MIEYTMYVRILKVANNMKHYYTTILLSFALLCMPVLCGCKEQQVEKSSFGQVDVFSDGDVLVDDVNGESEPETEISEEQLLTSDRPIKTSSKLDVDSLPAEVTKMIGLCDAINMSCVELQSAYNSSDTDFVWHCVHMYVANCRDEEMGFIKVGDCYEADPKIVNAVIYAMFGKLGSIPKVSGSAFDNLGGDTHVKISNGLKYQFSIGDRGMSIPQVRNATEYSDGSLEMEVALVNSETEEETVSFIYTMRANTRDTTTGALFAYEITGARPADRATSDKIEGMPFLVPVMQVYGYDAYDMDDPKHAQVEEVLYYGSFKEHVPGVDEINARISHEILEYANAPVDESSWHEVCSYPLTTDQYVQVAITFATYPQDTAGPDIRCYNYDKKKTRAMDINDALELIESSEEALMSRIGQLAGGGSSADIKGFIVRRDGSVDFFCMIRDEGTEKKLAAYNSGADELRVISDGEDVLPEDETDDMKPELTHGRKD